MFTKIGARKKQSSQPLNPNTISSKFLLLPSSSLPALAAQANVVTECRGILLPPSEACSHHLIALTLGSFHFLGLLKENTNIACLKEL